MAEERVNIGAYKTRFNGRLGAFKRGVLIKLFGAVIFDTPVDTGRLRANWTLSFQEGVYPPAQPDLFDQSGATTQSTVTNGVNSTVDEKDGVVNLSNSLPYVNRIEYEGWSHTKAPAGMVRRNMVRIALLLRQQANQQ